MTALRSTTDAKSDGDTEPHAAQLRAAAHTRVTATGTSQSLRAARTTAPTSAFSAATVRPRSALRLRSASRQIPSPCPGAAARGRRGSPRSWTGARASAHSGSVWGHPCGAPCRQGVLPQSTNPSVAPFTSPCSLSWAWLAPPTVLAVPAVPAVAAACAKSNALIELDLRWPVGISQPFRLWLDPGPTVVRGDKDESLTVHQIAVAMELGGGYRGARAVSAPRVSSRRRKPGIRLYVDGTTG